MKAVYYFVTFVAALLVIAFVGWNTYVQWPLIETTVRKALPSQIDPHRKCDCGPNCPKGGCGDNCTCEKQQKCDCGANCPKEGGCLDNCACEKQQKSKQCCPGH